jgi:hypothetical protein
MSEQSRAPAQWRTPPRRLGKITSDELETPTVAGELTVFVCYVGCGAGAIAALTAAAIAWGDALLQVFGAHL